MDNSVDHVRLVRRAQLGDRESLDKLTELAEERLRVDVFRLTLQEDLAGEIVQETLFEMLRVLTDLRDANRFWPWLYKIAINKVRLHYRREQRRKAAVASAAANRKSHDDGEQVTADAISKELREIVLSAMQSLKPRHRAVLTMRCYREMEYSQIAESMGCSELAAKMLFYRAKKSLRKQLGRFGFGKGMLLPALVLFGKITVPAKAAGGVTVPAATMKVGAAAGVVGFATSGPGALSVAAAVVLAGATMIGLRPGHPEIPAVPNALSSSDAAEQMGALQEGFEEVWCYYPQGADGPVMMRMLRWDSHNKQPYCQWLQNERATYYFDRPDNTVHVKNHRIWRKDLSVWRLPTDPPEMREFLSRVEGWIDGTQYVRGRGPGLLVIARRREDSNHSRVTRHFNVLDEQYFRYGWPSSVKIRTVDDRDQMHRRGWAYYRIDGRIGQKKIKASGRLPFVFGEYRRHGPWLSLRVGQDILVADNGSEARVYNGEKLVARYEGGSFFAGLGRPWMGLHTIDTVRRDAALQQIWFETELNAEEGTAQVVLNAERLKLVYTIDMDRDIIKRIEFLADGAQLGELEFSYLEQDGPPSGEFAPPRWSGSPGNARKSRGILWLVDLVAGKW